MVNYPPLYRFGLPNEQDDSNVKSITHYGTTIHMGDFLGDEEFVLEVLGFKNNFVHMRVWANTGFMFIKLERYQSIYVPVEILYSMDIDLVRGRIIS